MENNSGSTPVQAKKLRIWPEGTNGMCNPETGVCAVSAHEEPVQTKPNLLHLQKDNLKKL